MLFETQHQKLPKMIVIHTIDFAAAAAGSALSVAEAEILDESGQQVAIGAEKMTFSDLTIVGNTVKIKVAAGKEQSTYLVDVYVLLVNAEKPGHRLRYSVKSNVP